MWYWIFYLLAAFTLPRSPQLVVAIDPPGECAVTAIGSVETYLELHYDHEDPAAPGTHYTYTTGIEILTNETASVAYDWRPIAFEWYYKPYGALVDGEIVSPDPVESVYEGDYKLGLVCGVPPSLDYSPLVEAPESPSAFNGPHAIPGRIEAEDFNIGGPGVGYSDATVENSGDSLYRDGEGVDIKTISGAADNGHATGWNEAGEWLEYTIYVTVASDYTFGFRLLSASPTGQLHAEIDGVDITGVVNVPLTGEWNTDSWVTVEVPGVRLAEGEYVLRLVTDAGWYDLNHVDITLAEDCPAVVVGSVEMYLKAYYWHEDPEASGLRFTYVTENVIAENEEVGVEYAEYPAAIEWWYRPYGMVVAANNGWILGRVCGEVPSVVVGGLEKDAVLMASVRHD